MKPLPDILEIQPLTKPPNCTITVPGSKSITNRALILAALSDGKCTLRGALWADDTRIMVDALKELDFKISCSEPDADSNCTIEVEGCGGKIPKTKAELYVGNAGTAARFLTALVCLGHGEYTIRGDRRMHERPMKELFDALRKLGAKISDPDSGVATDHLPATIIANGLSSGEIPDHRIEIDPSRSTQFASALYLVSGRVEGGLSFPKLPKEYNPDPLGYIGMTEKMVTGSFVNEIKDGVWFYTVEPDFSSASYFVAAEFVTRDIGGRVKIKGWDTPQAAGFLQPDRCFPSYLEKLTPNAKLKVSRRDEIGDSVMTLAICALVGEEASLEIVDAGRLRLQETDRIKAMVTELKKVGGEKCAEEMSDGFIVHPGDPLILYDGKQKDIETYNDHRMAMCFSVLGLKVPGIRIKNAGCVSKTFPNFFDKLEQLRT